MNVAHMMYDYKSLKDSPTLQQKMNFDLAKACFNRETDFENLPSLQQRLSAPSKSPPAQYGNKLRRVPY